VFRIGEATQDIDLAILAALLKSTFCNLSVCLPRLYTVCVVVYIDMHAARFWHSLLSVNVDICMYVWMRRAISASLRLNILET